MTNPAIDREREAEHFSTQTVIGPRPPLSPNELEQVATFTLDAPIVLDDFDCSPFDRKLLRQVAAETGCATLDQLIRGFEAGRVTRLQTVTLPEETTMQGLERIAQSAVEAVRDGVQLLIFDDADSFRDGYGWIDPILILGVVDRALRQSFVEQEISSSTPLPLGDNGKIDLGLMASKPSKNLRRQTGLILRSGAIRNLHDVIMSIGMGADAVVPYLMFETTIHDVRIPPEEYPGRLKNIWKALCSGIEKCTSTMGIHELRGYGRLFASIGLSIVSL